MIIEYICQGKQLMQEKKEKYLESKRNKEEQEINNCTFKPTRNLDKFNTSQSNIGNAEMNRSEAIINNMYERTKKWNEEKNAKLQREREHKSQDQFSECTFAPNIKLNAH